MRRFNLLNIILTILLGIIISIICLELFLQTSSFLLSQYIDYKSYKTLKAKINNNDVITILCVGESTTYHQWPIQLREYLKNKSNKEFNIVTVALPSIGIESLVEKAFEGIETFKPSIVISMMGVNNAFNFDKKVEQIHKKYKIKTIELFLLLKKHFLQILKSNKSSKKDEPLANNENYYDMENKENIETEDNNKNRENDNNIEIENNENSEKYTEFVFMYSANDLPPKKFLDILDKKPNDILVLDSLVWLYRLRGDFENIKKYFNIYWKIRNTDNFVPINIFQTIVITFILEKDFERLEQIISYISSIKDKGIIDKIFKFSVVPYMLGRINLIDYEKVYDLLIKYKIDSSAVIYVYNYLHDRNIDVPFPEYEISLSKKPYFDTKEIKSSYISLAKYLQQKNIKYICMSYPTISIDVFKNFFKDTDLEHNIIFISNEYIFNDYLKHNLYDSIFIDQFGGTFGHCNAIGNKMIAEHVGKVILKLID